MLESLHPQRSLQLGFVTARAAVMGGMGHATYQARVKDVLNALTKFPSSTHGGRYALTALHCRHALSVRGSDMLGSPFLDVVEIAVDMSRALRFHLARAPNTLLTKANAGYPAQSYGLHPAQNLI